MPWKLAAPVVFEQRLSELSDNRKARFNHQNYLNYLIARRQPSEPSANPLPPNMLIYHDCQSVQIVQMVSPWACVRAREYIHYVYNYLNYLNYLNNQLNQKLTSQRVRIKPSETIWFQPFITGRAR